MTAGQRATARELQTIIEELQRKCSDGARLAQASGLVNPSYFRGPIASLAMAMGDLDQKGLWIFPPEETP